MVPLTYKIEAYLMWEWGGRMEVKNPRFGLILSKYCLSFKDFTECLRSVYIFSQMFVFCQI